VEDSNKHIIEETVRQVGHLPEWLLNVNAEKFVPLKVDMFHFSLGVDWKSVHLPFHS
jgi:hypothetical protein